MGKNKNKKLLLVIIILLIILILLAGVAFAYFQTDIFKGNKELFFNYIAQITDEEEGFIDEQLINYFEKQKNMPYTDKGKISVNIKDPNVEENIESTNNMNLSFSGQVDSANSKIEQNISLNYSDDVTFPLIYRQIEKTIGIQTDYIGKKFIVIDSTESQNNVFMDTQVVDSMQTFQKNSENIKKEDIEHIMSTYLQVLNSQLKESMFSQVKDQNRAGYRLTLTGEDLKNIVIAMLEQLKNDQQTLDILNNAYLENQNGINVESL